MSKIYHIKANRQVTSIFTAYTSDAKSCAEFHVSTARRLLKADGNYPPNDIILNDIKRAAEVSALSDSGGICDTCVLTFKSELKNGSTLIHTMQIPNFSITFQESV